MELKVAKNRYEAKLINTNECCLMTCNSKMQWYFVNALLETNLQFRPELD